MQINEYIVSFEHNEFKLIKYLQEKLNKIPKNHLYKIIRSGEIRVNSKRSKSDTILFVNDRIRIPPIYTKPKPELASKKLDVNILYEDDYYLAIDKNAGMASHGGSGLYYGGIIEQLRLIRPEDRDLELVHRLDRKTSGILLMSKTRPALKRMHEIIVNRCLHKKYYALVYGEARANKFTINLPLNKTKDKDGKTHVIVDRVNGKEAITNFTLKKKYSLFTLLECELITGRTHQIRVHLSHSNMPIALDDKYSTHRITNIARSMGLERMFLHACKLGFFHPFTKEKIIIRSRMPPALSKFMDSLE